MSELDRLLNVPEPAWPEVRRWIDAAAVPVEVLLPNPEARGPALLQVGVTIGSAMGAVVHETGGLLIDHGWVRVFGSGCSRLPRKVEADRGWVLVADDLVGGFFALHPPEGVVRYLAPDTLEWEPLGSKYSAWMRWLLGGSTSKFYEPYRGAHWEGRSAELKPDQTFMIVPPPWAAGSAFPERAWKPAPAREVYGLTVEMAYQLRKKPATGV